MNFRSKAIQFSYWSIWLLAAATWFYVDAAESRDHRVHAYFIGLLAIGALTFVWLPAPVISRLLPLGLKNSIFGRLPIPIVLWGLASVAFLAASNLLGIAMQHFVIAVETNDLPLLRDTVAASTLWVGFGHLVGLCSSTFQPADDAAHFVPNALVPCVSLLIGTTLLFVG